MTALCPGPTETGFASSAHMESSRLFRLMRPMSSAIVAEIGYSAMERGKRVVIAGMTNGLLAASVRVSPRRVATTIARKMQERG